MKLFELFESHRMVETFDSPYDIAYERSPDNITRAQFRTDNGLYKVKVRGDSRAFVEFHNDSLKHSPFGINNREGTSAGKVISSVIQVVKKHLKKNPHVKSIHFSANKTEESRIKLYRKLAKITDPNYKEDVDDEDYHFTLSANYLKPITESLEDDMKRWAEEDSRDALRGQTKKKFYDLLDTLKPNAASHVEDSSIVNAGDFALENGVGFESLEYWQAALSTAEMMIDDPKGYDLNLNESPISDVQFHGDFEIGKPSSFPDMDKKLFKKPDYIPKVFKAFEKTPFNIKVVFLDKEFDDDLGYEGIHDGRIFGVNPDKDAITLIIINNQDLSDPNTTNKLKHMPMTNFMIGHKVGHSLLATREIERYFYKIIKPLKSPLKRFFTFKSAENPNADLGEMFCDCVAQYLIQGKVTIKSQIGVEDAFNKYFFEVFSSLKGKILVAM